MSGIKKVRSKFSPMAKQNNNQFSLEQIKTIFIKWLANHEGVLFNYHAFWYVQNCVGDLIHWKESPTDWLTKEQKEKWLAPPEDIVTPTKKVVIHIDNSEESNEEGGKEGSKEKETSQRKTHTRRQTRQNSKSHSKGKR